MGHVPALPILTLPCNCLISFAICDAAGQPALYSPVLCIVLPVGPEGNGHDRPSSAQVSLHFLSLSLSFFPSPPPPHAHLSAWIQVSTLRHLPPHEAGQPGSSTVASKDRNVVGSRVWCGSRPHPLCIRW